MSKTSLSSRPQALRMLATLPMLPLGAMAAGSLLSGCAIGGTVGSAGFASASFLPMAAPSLADAAAMATTTVGSSLQVTHTNGAVDTYKLAYRSFFTTGDMVPDGAGGSILSGGCYDIVNRPVIDRSVPGRERQFFSDCPDGTSLLQLPRSSVKGVKGNAVFVVVQFEYTSQNQKGDSAYGTLPSPMAVLTLDQDPKTEAQPGRRSSKSISSPTASSGAPRSSRSSRSSLRSRRL